MARGNTQVKVQAFPPVQQQTYVQTTNDDFFGQNQRILNTTPITTQSKVVNLNETKESQPTTTYTTSKVYYNQP